MISITKLDFFQPIDKQEDIFPSIFQQEQVKFGFAAEIFGGRHNNKSKKIVLKEPCVSLNTGRIWAKFFF